MTNNDVWSLESRKVRSHRDMTYFFHGWVRKKTQRHLSEGSDAG